MPSGSDCFPNLKKRGRSDTISGENTPTDTNLKLQQTNQECYVSEERRGLGLIIDGETLVELAGNYCPGAEMCPDSSSPGDQR